MRSSSLRRSSDLHLGLGRFLLFDEAIIPGPSPPCSPAPSPTKRTFAVHSHIPVTRTYTASPLTPTRAPRKAAKLLGADLPSSHLSPSAMKPKKKDHFRPLPSSKLHEIDMFFGNVPRKPSTKPRGLKLDKEGKPKHRNQAPPTISAAPRTVTHVSEDGSMWLDVEEEQEFAWLMSEIFQWMPSTPVESYDEEAEWGMETFTSVLALPKQKRSQQTQAPRPASPSLSSSPPRIRNRPPPLTLSSQLPKSSRKLPLLTASKTPTTPFVRPRAAPRVPD
ncbi:hypothetical protein P7C73_g4155, partial [Tremellales sp. Uapishka_1]